eukprot:COSAG05_NODE_6772_length_905_cov_1.921836_1_plen_75_part_00
MQVRTDKNSKTHCADTVGCTVSTPKNQRKGYEHAIRLDLAKPDDQKTQKCPPPPYLLVYCTREHLRDNQPLLLL